VTNHLQNAGLPASLSNVPGPRPSAERLLEFMQRDKKAEGGRLKFVLVRGLGKAFVSADVPTEAVTAVLSEEETAF
jgi:3-dehydroquinate synthase